RLASVGVVGGQMWGAGDRYEPYMGRWSRRVAAEFVSSLGIAPGARWLDVGCGTAALTATVLGSQAPAWVLAVDPSYPFVSHGRRFLAGDRRARFAVGNAMALPVGSGTVDGIVSGLVLNFVPDPVRAVREMRRVVATCGLVAAYVWDY